MEEAGEKIYRLLAVDLIVIPSNVLLVLAVFYFVVTWGILLSAGLKKGFYLALTSLIIVCYGILSREALRVTLIAVVWALHILIFWAMFFYRRGNNKDE